MPPYVYDELDLVGEPFRLLKLFGGSGNDIICELMPAHMRKPNMHTPNIRRVNIREPNIQYEALSYTWGSEETPREIHIGQSQLPVTQNVFDALKHLRRRDKHRILWIDAICINQASIHERNHQVQQMRFIYQTAKRVIFWMGCPSVDARLVIRALREFNKRMITLGWKNLDELREICWEEVQCVMANRFSNAWQRQLNGLRELLSQSWFKRVWIIQEVASARRAVIQCRDQTITCRVFALAPQLFNVHATLHCQNILDAMPTPCRPNSWWRHNRDLYSLLQKFPHAEAKLDRDIIYALLGICNASRDDAELLVDYEKPIQDVINDTISYMLCCNRGSLPTSLFLTLQSFLKSLDTLETKVLSMLVQSNDHQSVESILQRRSTLLRVSQSIFLGAVRNEIEGTTIVRLLLGLAGPELNVTQEIMLAAARNQRQGSRIFQILLAHADVGVDLTSEFIWAIIMNEGQRSALMDQLSEKVLVPNELILRATGSRTHFINMMEFLGREGQRLEVTEALLRTAAQNSTSGVEVLHMIYQYGQGNFHISEAILVAAAQNAMEGPGIMDFFLRRHEFKITPILLVAILRNNNQWTNLLITLLKYGPIDWPPHDECFHQVDDQRVRDMMKFSINYSQEQLLRFAFHIRPRAFMHEHEDDDSRHTAKRKLRSPYPLLLAVKSGNISILEILLDNGYDIERYMGDLLHAALEKPNDQIVRLLLGKGIPVDAKNESGSTALMLAAENDSESTLRILIEHGASINEKNRNGSTALTCAAWNDSRSTLRILLESGASVNAKEDYGFTALMHAAMSGYESTLRILLEHGASVDEKNEGGITALMWAAMKGLESTLRILLEHRASINEQDAYGSTALMYAARNGFASSFRVLLEYGASIHHIDMYGSTALTLAQGDGRNKIVEILKAHGSELGQ